MLHFKFVLLENDLILKTFLFSNLRLPLHPFATDNAKCYFQISATDKSFSPNLYLCHYKAI